MGMTYLAMEGSIGAAAFALRAPLGVLFVYVGSELKA